jgi:hypothetical protein
LPTDTSLSFSTLLAWPAALFLLFVPGFVTLIFLLSSGKRPPALQRALGGAEYLFWSLALSLFFDGWLSLTLAELGLFSLGAVFALATLYSLAIIALRRHAFQTELSGLKTLIQNPKSKIQNPQGFVLVLLLLGTLALNYYAPHETVVGSQDSGVYFNAGASIARTGGIIVKDPLLPALAEAGPKTQPQLLLGMPGRPDRFLFVSQQRLPGEFIYGKDDGLQKGLVIPQLFHLYPALLALGMSLFGLWGGLLVSPLLGVMGVFALYLTTRRLFPTERQKWVAPLAALFLVLNAVQVWFSRETLWEILGQFLVFSATYAFTLIARPVPLTKANAEAEPAIRDEGAANLGGFGVGAALGLVCLAHSQFPFMVWVLFPYLVWMRLTRRWGAPQWWMLGTFGVLALHTLLHIRIFSLAYFEGIYHNVYLDLLSKIHLVIPALALAFLVLILIDAMPRRVQAIGNWVKKHWGWFSVGLAAVLTVYLLYSYFFRVYDVSTDQQGNYPTQYWSLQSYIGAPTTEGPERNLLRLGWYLSPLGILLAILGLAAIVSKKLNAQTGFFLALTLGVTYIFLDYNYTQEHYIYSMRRYVTATIPALSVFAAYACIVTLPDLLQWAWNRLARFSRRRLAYAASASGPNAAIAFTIIEESESRVQSPESRVKNPQHSALSTPRSPIVNRQSSIVNLLGLAFAAGIILFMVWTGKTVFTVREYGPEGQTPGVVEQLRQLAGRFGPKDVLIFVGERDQDAKLATPLTYSFGVPSFNLIYAVKNDELGDLLRLWEKQGYHIKALLGPNGGRFAPTGYTLKQTGEVNIVFHQFQQLVIQKPNNTQTNLLSYGIYDVVSGSGAVSFGEGQVDNKQGWTLPVGKNDWPALVNGFYSAERDPDGLVYRWTETDGELRVPCLAPDGGPARLTLKMGGGTRPANLPPLQVKVYMSYNPYEEPTFNDPKRLQPLATLTLKPGVQDYTVDLPAGQDKLTCGNRASSLILWLTVDATRTWVPQEQRMGDDTRRLAIKFAGLNLASK